MSNVTPRMNLSEQGKLTGFYAVDKVIQRSTHFTSKVTGESVELSQVDKTVLFYLVDKLSFYITKEKPMTESMAYIGNELCLNDRTVGRSVKKLIEHGVVTATKQSAALGYVYTWIDVNQKWTKEVTGNMQQRMQPNPINVQAPVSTVQTFADTTPDVGMPEHMNAPVFDYSDVFSQMQDSGSEPRVSVAMVDDEFDCELPFG